MKRRLPLAVLYLLFIPSANAHPFAPGYLELTSSGPQRWQAVFRKPKVGRDSAVRPTWPDHCRATAMPADDDEQRWWLACTERFEAIGVEGFVSGAEEVLVRVVTSSTSVAELYRLTDRRPRIERPTPSIRSTEPKSWPAIGAYFRMGVEHILLGYDHLAFILLLVLWVPSARSAVMHLTLFTLAHSVTLALAALGVVVVAPAPTEAVIALSIAFAAREVARSAVPNARSAVPNARRSAGLSFGFGLLHGLGLAGALTDVGLPPGRQPEALLGFNLGVEGGQLIVVAAILVLTGLLRMNAPKRWLTFRITAAYAVGAFAMYWTGTRIMELSSGA